MYFAYILQRYAHIGLGEGARRKNATRETTSTLKAWLNEHRKNPYPTKAEKIMLAIVTRMTLTQVRFVYNVFVRFYQRFYPGVDMVCKC